MALINCSECGKQISENADSCPNCGNPILYAKKKSGCLYKIFIYLILLPIFAVSIFWVIDGSSDSTSSKSSPDTSDYVLAYNYAEKYVKEYLKSPSTAEFPSTREKVAHTHYNSSASIYRINSWVDSQNSFGAMIRQRFSCEIIMDGKTVSIRNLKFEQN